MKTFSTNDSGAGEQPVTGLDPSKAEEVAAEAHEESLARERTLLTISTASAAVFAVVGIVWGLLANSQVVLLDGAYALVGLLLGGLSLRVAALVERGPTPRYPFGREALGPVVVGVQGLVLLGTFSFASLEAISVILEGGSDTSFGSALGYALASLVGSLVLWALLRKRGHDSELVGAEAAQWAAGWVLSAGMFLGFAIALVLQRTSLAWMAGYMDSVLVLLATIVILPTPIRMLRTVFRELLEGIPEPEVTAPVMAVIAEVNAARGLPEPEVRIGKLGRKLYLELDYLVDASRQLGEADEVRRDLMRELAEPGRLLWINVELHTDPDWDRL